MDERYRVRDGDRNLEFVGQLLAKATSQDGSKLRWTEVEIYRSAAGKYIVATLGCSNDPNEQTFYRASVAESGRGAIELLHQVDPDGVRYLTWTARQALDRACALDEELKEAYQYQVID